MLYRISACVILAALAFLAVDDAGAVTIGLMAPTSGSQAIVGQDQVDGFNLALEQLGSKLGGRSVRVVQDDDQLKPEIGLQIVRKFIEKDKVDAIVGLSFSNVLMSTLPRLAESGTVAIATNAGPSPLAGAGCKPNVFSVAWQNDGAAEAMGKFAQDKGVKRVYLMAPNYQAGKDMLAGFKRFFKGEVIGETYTQVNQPDYSAELAQLQSAKPDAAFVFYPGGMGVNFVKQMGQAGLLAKVPLYSVFTVDGTTLPSLRDSAAGGISGAMWDAALDVPESRKFVASFEVRFKRAPSEYAATAYDAANLLDAALVKVKGESIDPKALADAVKAAGSEFKSVRGPFRFNNNNLPIQNYYAFEAAKDAGKLVVRQIGTPLTAHADAYHTQCTLKQP